VTFAADIRSALARNAGWDELLQVVVRHRDAGLTQRAAYEALQELRAGLTEPEEDQILDLMDRVHGWCSADQRLWRTTLSD
jgi:hypothetical protein